MTESRWGIDISENLSAWFEGPSEVALVALGMVLFCVLVITLALLWPRRR